MTLRLSIRAKITLWNFALSAVALCLFGVISFGALRFTLLAIKQKSLARREQRLLLLLDQTPATTSSLNAALQQYAITTHEGNLFQIRATDGHLIFPEKSPFSDWLSQPTWNCSHAIFKEIHSASQPIAIYCHAAVLHGRPVTLYFGGALDEDFQLLNTYVRMQLVALPLLMCLAAFGAFLLSKRALAPVDRMTKAIVEMGVNDLSARLPEPHAHDELWHLAITWNQLLARLDSAVQRLTKFSADASHDLRTSITVILTNAELSLQRKRSQEEYRDCIARIADECRTATTLLDALLALARSDNFVHESNFKKINAAELVVAACRRVEDLAGSKGIILDWSLPEEDPFIEGDDLLLQRLLGILLDNAIKYTPESGQIIAEVRTSAFDVTLTVMDTGIGISEAAQQRIFDRFYQADLRERRREPGNGLGLSIAKWIADAHRATLTVESTLMVGSTFQIRFPSVASPASAFRSARADRAMIRG